MGSEREQIVALPERPDKDLIEILGRPCFQCINIANVLRLGGWKIANRAEDEQAATILFLLRHWAADQTNWRDNADTELQAMADARGDHLTTERTDK